VNEKYHKPTENEEHQLNLADLGLTQDDIVPRDQWEGHKAIVDEANTRLEAAGERIKKVLQEKPVVIVDYQKLRDKTVRAYREVESISNADIEELEKEFLALITTEFYGFHWIYGQAHGFGPYYPQYYRIGPVQKKFGVIISGCVRHKPDDSPVINEEKPE